MATNHAQLERRALCDLFEEVGPHAPTLCEGWDAADLAAHLVVRERRPDAALGILSSLFERHGESVRRSFAARPFDELVELVRNGPPRLSPFGLPGVDRLANTMEFFIHHEDVRRCNGGTPRELDADLDDQLWSALTRAARLLLRGAPCAVELRTPDGRTRRAGRSGPGVVVTAPVGELAMFVYGRQGAAQVELDGEPDQVAALRAASFGI
jgi:uncharacterized protein (TIGR03085 family)